MTATIPIITALVAAILGLLGAALAANAIANRLRPGTGAGDDGEASLARAIRAQGNFSSTRRLP